MTDRQKSAVYDAEHVLCRLLKSEATTFDFYGSMLTIPQERNFGDIEGVQRYVDAVLALNWVKEAWKAAERPVKVRARKGEHKAHYSPLTATIAVFEHKGVHTSWAMRETVVLHELAHHLTPNDIGHQQEFVSTLVKLVSEIIGQEAGLVLTDALVQNGVNVVSL